MKKNKFPSKFFTKSQILGFLNYIFLILLTSILFVDILIALPLTEKISNFASYDLKTKNQQYWAKEYTLELDTTDVIDKDTVINEVKDILDRRLVSSGVEKRTITRETKDEKEYIKVSVQSIKDQTQIDELIRSPFILNVVTRKSDVNFEDENDPYAMYFVQNYDSTPFTRDTFRNIYITKLKNSANEYSYFALYKTWPWQSEWKTFIQENQGQTIGVSIDGFVTPIQVPTNVESFALPLSSIDATEARLVSILYNSGIMPTSYTQTSQRELEVEQIESDYIKLTEGILISVILIYIYLLFVDRTSKQVLIHSGLSTLLTLATWISYLKITSIPVDISLLAIEVIAIIAILRVTTENKESNTLINVLLSLVISIAIILGTGYVKLFATDMLSLIILGIACQLIAAYYINKIKTVLRV